MIDSHDPPRTVRGDFELLSHDLASVYGTLSEITAVWRRAHQDWPELPLRLPLQLQDATRQLTVSAQALVDAGPGLGRIACIALVASRLLYPPATPFSRTRVRA